MKLLFWCGLTLMGLFAAASFSKGEKCAPPPTAENGYVTREFTDAAGQSMTYYLHVPCNDQAQQLSYPLVLLLHGGGEHGQSGNPPEQNRSILVGNPYVKQWTSEQIQNQWPSFVVVPQLMGNQNWVDVPSTQGVYHIAHQPTPALLLAKEIVSRLEQTYPDLDPGRLYITGISIGGYGVWDAIERWPAFFAAAAPVSGGGDPTGAFRLTRLPIWAFHGGNDGDPPASASRAVIQAIRTFGGRPRYTEYPQAGHDIWLQVYTSPAFLSWLFAQKSAPAMPHRAPLPTFGEAMLQHITPFLQKYWALFMLCCLVALQARNIRKQYKQWKEERTSR